MKEDQDKRTLDTNTATELAADIVSAYVGNNAVAATDLPGLIRDVHQSVVALDGNVVAKEPVVLKPAVPIKKSVADDHIVCLEDGKKFKSLKRHLQANHGLTPGEYRAKWNLPADYPMVAPSYSKKRSKLAKTIGLGRKR